MFSGEMFFLKKRAFSTSLDENLFFSKGHPTEIENAHFLLPQSDLFLKNYWVIQAVQSTFKINKA
jgi:hypothetical protein